MRPYDTTRQTDQTDLPQAAVGPPRAAAWVAAVVLALFIGVAYLPAIDSPFIFDDDISIVKNDSIVSLWPLVRADTAGPLNPPSEHPTSGRPLVNLSFAINYHFGGLNPIGYHLVNIAIHYLSALLLWAIVRRTLRLPYFDGRFVRSADWLALAAAMLWALHPLQTEAVIYATQRTELMMAFFYLATFYCSLRYWELFSFRSRDGLKDGRAKDSQKHLGRSIWLFFTVAACCCGMASKEVMVSAPLMVLFFERTFVAGTLISSVRRSWPLYLGLASTWLLLVGFTLADPRPDSAGFHLGIPAYVWWLTQSQILFLYLKLVVWPWPLLIHYELDYLTGLGEAWFYVVPLLLVGVLTLVLLWKNRPVGFLGTWFFAILSPTFVIPVVTEMAAERRMYLALAPLVLIFVMGVYRLAEVYVRQASIAVRGSRLPTRLVATCLLSVVLTLVFCFVSASRLTAYESELTLWMEVMHSQPENPRAYLYAASFLESRGRIDEAIEQYREVIRLHPNPVQAQHHLGELLSNKGAYSEAATYFGKAARGMPKKNANMYNAEAVALYLAGDNDRAIQAFHETIAIDPNFWAAYRNLGTALQKAGKFQEAVESFETALRLNPKAIDIYNDLANSHFRLNQRPQAIVALERGLELAQAAGDTENAKKFAAALQAKR